MLKKIVNILHGFIPLFYILQPFLPFNYIPKTYFFLLINNIIWLLCDGCPLTNYAINENKENKKNRKSYIHTLLNLMFGNITPKKSEDIVQLIMVLNLTIIIYRILKKCNIN